MTDAQRLERQRWEDQDLPRELARDGAFVLHAGLLSRDGHAIALTAPTGTGKSTLTAALHLSGWRLLSDDAAILDPEALTARAVNRRLVLLSDSLETVLGNPPETEDWRDWKRRIDLPPDPGADRTVPLAAVFALQPPAPEVTVKTLPPAAATMALVGNSFAWDASDARAAAGRLEQAAALARRIPVYSLAYPRDYARLPEVIGAIGSAMATA